MAVAIWSLFDWLEKERFMKIAPEILERVAKAVWDWEHDNRESKILDIEWSLLRSDYLCKAQVAITAYNDSMDQQSTDAPGE